MKAKTVTFNKKYLVNELGLPDDVNNTDRKLKVIRDHLVGHSRWSIEYELIFKLDDTYYLTYYSIGATEQQDESPWEYDDEVVCTVVEPKEKTITVINYVPMDDYENES